MLVSDGTLGGVVMHTGRLDSLKVSETDDTVVVDAEAGLQVRKLLAFAIRNRLGGAEFLTGIPGTVGGALWGNAGAGGTGFAPLVKSVTTVGTDGAARILNGNELSWKYRSCPFDSEHTALVTTCQLVFSRSPAENIRAGIRKYAELKRGQPLGRHTAGCVFKNPDGESAGRLLDESGCKGLRLGGAEVSSFHANFIENTGSATAADIFGLCEKCRERVFSRHGVKLEYEIHFFGTFEKNQETG